MLVKVGRTFMLLIVLVVLMLPGLPVAANKTATPEAAPQAPETVCRPETLTTVKDEPAYPDHLQFLGGCITFDLNSNLFTASSQYYIDPNITLKMPDPKNPVEEFPLWGTTVLRVGLGSL